MTQLDIWNLSLRHIGMNKLADTTGNDPRTLVLTDFFVPCRDEVFAGSKWSFATVQTALTAYAGAESVPLGWEFAYDHPTTNCAAVWSVFNEGTLDDKDEQDFSTFYFPSESSKVLVSDLDDAYAEYTHIIEDPSEWPVRFCITMSYHLAASICASLTGDADRAIKLMSIYSAYLQDSQRIDFYHQSKKPKITSSRQNAR